jgi:hypothetical protein
LEGSKVLKSAPFCSGNHTKGNMHDTSSYHEQTVMYDEMSFVVFVRESLSRASECKDRSVKQALSVGHFERDKT